MSITRQSIETKPIYWSKTSDAEFPYEATVDGHQLRLRVNDFPAEPYFTVMEGEQELFDIAGWTEGWPAGWTRDKP